MEIKNFRRKQLKGINNFISVELRNCLLNEFKFDIFYVRSQREHFFCENKKTLIRKNLKEFIIRLSWTEKQFITSHLNQICSTSEVKAKLLSTYEELIILFQFNWNSFYWISLNGRCIILNYIKNYNRKGFNEIY